MNTTPLRIAVADDEPEMRCFFTKLLPRAGHQVVAVAEDGQQLVDQCRRTRPDLIITDVKMPKLDGIEACAELCREHPAPIILISAFQAPGLLPRIERIPVMAYLVKPIGLGDLQSAIAIAMDRYRLLEGEERKPPSEEALSDRRGK